MYLSFSALVYSNMLKKKPLDLLHKKFRKNVNAEASKIDRDFFFFLSQRKHIQQANLCVSEEIL